MERKTITYKVQPVSYRITGNGKPVILIHGFGEDGTIWNQQVEFLKTGYQLVIPDLPGSGLSAFNSHLSTVEDYAEAIKAILDAEKISTCAMLGHSMGGYIMLAFAEKYADRLNAIGLIHSSAYADTEEKIAGRKKAIEFMEANGGHAFLKTAIPGLFSEEWSKLHQQQVDALVEAGKQFSMEALINYYRLMIARPGRTAILKQTPLPVLFIMGVHDKAVPFEHSMQQSHLPSISNIHILRNSAHMGMWEEADKTNSAILEFLDSL